MKQRPLREGDKFLMPASWPGQPPCSDAEEPKVEWEVIRTTRESAAVKRTARRTAVITHRNKTVRRGGLVFKVPTDPHTTTIEAEDVRLIHISTYSLVEKVGGDGTLDGGPDRTDLASSSEVPGVSEGVL